MSAFRLTPSEDLLTVTARRYLDGFVDNTHLLEVERSPAGFDEQRWKEMISFGWTSVALPETVGGGGGTVTDAAILARELGRAAYPSPYLETARAAVVATAIGGEVGDAVAARIADGHPVGFLASGDTVVRSTTAGYATEGKPLLADWPQACAAFLCLFPLADGSDASICALLERDRVGVTDLVSSDNQPVGLLTVADLADAPTVIVDQEHAGEFRARADVLRASEMVGGARAVLELSVRYMQERHQFGRALATFQAVQHHLARMAIAVDAAELVTDEALTAVDGPRPSSGSVAIAIFVAGRSYVETVLTGAHLHGGIGCTTEHVLHHHFRRAKATQVRGGTRASQLLAITTHTVQRPHGIWANDSLRDEVEGMNR